MGLIVHLEPPPSFVMHNVEHRSSRRSTHGFHASGLITGNDTLSLVG
jgi:hypothetical protein